MSNVVGSSHLSGSESTESGLRDSNDTQQDQADRTEALLHTDWLGNRLAGSGGGVGDESDDEAAEHIDGHAKHDRSPL